MDIRSTGKLVKGALNDWREDRVPVWASALAYRTIFSIAPLVVIAIGIAGLIFGQEAAQGQIVTQLTGALGPDGAQAVQSLLAGAGNRGSGIWATVIGTLVLLWAASSLVATLQGALDAIWEVRPERGGIKLFLRDRVLALLFVLGIGVLLLASMLLSALMSAFWQQIREVIAVPMWVLSLADVVVSLALATALFAALFKVLPHAKIAWRDVWVGAVVTAALFVIGKIAFTVYIGLSDMSSSYGPASSLVVLLVWINYSSQILLFGAEVAQAWARGHGRALEPGAHAAPTPS